MIVQQALQIMLFGMLGIFLVMGLIIIAVYLLRRLESPKKGRKNAKE